MTTGPLTEASLGGDTLATRAVNALAANGVTTWEHLAALSDDALLKLPRIGDLVLARVRTLLPPPAVTATSLLWRTDTAGRVLYAMRGLTPSPSDPIIGVMDTTELAAAVVADHNRTVKTGATDGPHEDRMD